MGIVDSVTAIILLIALTLLLIAVVLVVVVAFYAAPYIKAQIEMITPINRTTESKTKEVPGVPLEQFSPSPNQPLGIKFTTDPQGREIMEEDYAQS